MIKKISSFTEISSQHFSPDTLILVDIDNTLIRSSTYHGSVEHMEDIFYQEYPKGKYTYAQLCLQLVDLWNNLQSEIETKLVDNKAPQFIEKAKGNNIVIGFTKRDFSISRITFNQLQKHNLFLTALNGFNFFKNYSVQTFPDKCELNAPVCKKSSTKEFINVNATFNEGILFSHDLIEKGKVFEDFFYTLTSYLQANKNAPIKNIVFIDDKKYNLESMKKTAKKLKLNFFGYHIIGK